MSHPSRRLMLLCITKCALEADDYRLDYVRTESTRRRQSHRHEQLASAAATRRSVTPTELPASVYSCPLKALPRFRGLWNFRRRGGRRWLWNVIPFPTRRSGGRLVGFQEVRRPCNTGVEIITSHLSVLLLKYAIFPIRFIQFIFFFWFSLHTRNICSKESLAIGTQRTVESTRSRSIAVVKKAQYNNITI